MPVSPKSAVDSRFHAALTWLDLTEPHGRPRLPSAPGALHPKRRRLASRNFSMTPPERREAARLRSERWRRAHGSCRDARWGSQFEFQQWVELGCGAVALGRACLFPPLSSDGALVARP